MNMRMATKTFEIQPLGPYSLEESASFIDAWHQPPAEGTGGGGHLHLAFLTEHDWEPVGVCLTQDGSGVVHGEVYGEAGAAAGGRQGARSLSPGSAGRAGPQGGRRERVGGMLRRGGSGG